MPHQSTSHSSNESLQKTQYIAIIEEPHASSSNSMPKVELIVADRQHVPLADSELPENMTAGFTQISSRTKPVVRHRGADAHDLSPSPPNFLTLPLRPPVQPARTAVGVSCHGPDYFNDSIVAPHPPTVSLPASVPSLPMPLHHDIPDNLPTCLNFNHISTLRVVTTPPILTHTEINGGAEVPGDATSPPASTLLSPVPSHSCGSSPKHLHRSNSNHDYGPAPLRLIRHQCSRVTQRCRPDFV
jgi:hypothetical protein